MKTTAKAGRYDIKQITNKDAEMDLIWIIYLMDVVTTNGGYGAISFCLAAGIVVIYLIRYLNDCPEIGKRALAPLISSAVVFAILQLVLPTKDTAYKMLAAYGVTEIDKTDEAKRLGSKSIEVIEKVMDDYLKEAESH
jgi:hypothetical protein